MKKNAFTLAEVLITLGIIGVVAALTMPTLIAKYQKHETVTKLKKTYAVLSQALQMSISENGIPNEWDWELGGYDFAKKYITPYFKITKDCGVGGNAECYIHSLTFLNDRSLGMGDFLYGFITSDGIIYNSRVHQNVRIYFYVDINGSKGPNIVSKDVFVIVFDKRGSSNNYTLFFDGAQSCTSHTECRDDNLYGCSKDSFYAGWWCGALMHMDGWKISDDYPW